MNLFLKSYKFTVYLQNNERIDFQVGSLDTYENLKGQILEELGVERGADVLFQIVSGVYITSFEERYVEQDFYVMDTVSYLFLKRLKTKTRFYLKMVAGRESLVGRQFDFDPLQFQATDLYYNLNFQKIKVESKHFLEIMTGFIYAFSGGQLAESEVSEEAVQKHIHEAILSKKDLGFWVGEVKGNLFKFQGKTKAQVFEKALGIVRDSYPQFYNCQVYSCVFSKSTVNNYGDNQVANLLIVVNQSGLVVMDRDSRDVVQELTFTDLASWGLNQDTLLLQFG